VPKGEIKPKIGHWSAHVLCWAFIIIGIMISLSTIKLINYDFIGGAIAVYFVFAGVFLMLESLMESGRFRMPSGLDIISAIIAIVAFMIGLVTFTKPVIPVEWSGVYFLMSFIVACAIGLEFYTE
jgi:hypothetical protein